MKIKKLPILIFAGIALGTWVAVMTSYLEHLNQRNVVEKELSQIAYSSYLDNWEFIKNEKRVVFDFAFSKIFAIKVKGYIAGSQGIDEFLQGIKKVNKEKYDDATQNFERVFNARTAYLENLSLLYYGYCKQATKDYKSALKAYLRLEELSNDLPEVFLNMVVIYKNLGETKKAEEYRQKYEIAIIKNKAKNSRGLVHD